MPEEQELIRALRDVRPARFQSDFVADVTSKVNIDADDIEKIMDVLTTLFRTRARTDLSISDFVDTVCESLKAIDDPRLTPSDGNWEPFKTHLKTFLRLDETVGVASKALWLAGSFERVFDDAQIVTDVRPIFRANANEAPAAALLVHNLTIRYQHSGEIGEFFVALEPEDIRTLRRLLERAEHKAKSLKAILDSASVPLLQERSGQ